MSGKQRKLTRTLPKGRTTAKRKRRSRPFLDWSYFEEDIRELKHRAKISGIALLSSILFFLVFPANLNSDLLGFYKPVVSVLLDWIRGFLLPSNVQFLSGSPGTPIAVYTIAGIFFGFLVASPVIFYEVYAFIRPAIPDISLKLIGIALGLFLCGCGFGFFLLMPAVMYGLLAFFPYVGVNNYFINVQDFYSMVFWTVLISGLCFLTPILIYLAVKYVGLDPKMITGNRKYLWGIIYIGSAIVTPDSNILADFVLFIPLIMMVEGSLFFARRSLRKNVLLGNLEPPKKS